MKRKKSSSLFALATGAALLVALPQTAVAQGINELVGKAQLASKENNWAEAYPLFKQATELYEPENGVELYGAQSMAFIWFNRGRGAQELGKIAARGADEASKKQANELYQDAIDAYTQCGKVGTDLKENPQKNRINHLIGQCLLSMGKPEEAIKAWDTFTAAYTKRNSTEAFVLDGQGKGKFILDRSIAFFRKAEPDLKEGLKGLDYLALPKTKQRYKITGPAIVLGFQAFCQATLKEVEKAKDSQSRKDRLEKSLITYMIRHRDTLTLSPYQMYNFTPLFIKLSIDCKKLGLDKAAFMFQSFLPSSIESKEDMELKLANLGGYKGMVDHHDNVFTAEITQSLSNFETQVGKGEPHEITQNLVLADYHESEGNSRAAFAIYEMIELYHSDHPKREDWLFHAVRTSYLIKDAAKLELYGHRFRSDFPQSSHKSNVEQFILLFFFQNNEFEKCAELAETFLPSIKSDTEEHRLALYCLAGSYYYLGQSAEARAPLGEHVKLYGKGGKHKESPYSLATQYWEAANETYLQEWAQAAQKLDAFLRDYPDPAKNVYFPNAIYDRANCYTNLEEYEKSTKSLDEIINKYPNCGILDQVYALRANNNENLSNDDKAQEDYKLALEVAQKANNQAVEAEVLTNLILLLGDASQPEKTEAEKKKKAENFKATLQYYDTFWAKYSDKGYNGSVATVGLAALSANGRGEEGLANLKQIIQEHAKQEASPRISSLIEAYTEEYLSVHNDDAEKLKSHYAKDFNISKDSVYAQSLVKMSLVDTYSRLEKAATKLDDKAAAKKWKKASSLMLKELSTFDLTKLNNSTLVTIGESLRQSAETTIALQQATRFHEQVLANVKSSKELGFKNEAIFGLASALIDAEDKTKLPKAYKDLQQVRDSKESDKRTKEKAHFTMVKIAGELGDFSAVITEAESFASTYKTSSYRTLVRLTLADAQYEKGDKAEALKHYRSVVSSAPGFIDYSGPAMLRTMEMIEKKYEKWAFGEAYVRSVRKSFEEAAEKGAMSSKQQDIWESIKDAVSDLEADAEVQAGKAEAEKIEEARKRVRGIR